MKPLHILHLEDRRADADLVRTTLDRNGIAAEISVVDSEDRFREILAHRPVDLVLLDNGVPTFSGDAALRVARAQRPLTPVVFVTGRADEKRASIEPGAARVEIVAKGDAPGLLAAVRHALEPRPAAAGAAPRDASAPGMRRLVAAVQQLSTARTLDAVMAIARTAARELTGADGATFVLRDGDRCHYAAEDAIEPLWEGRRFPIENCVSGWAMLHGETVVIPDIYRDPRVPIEAYRPTFVKSLVLVPIRTADPIGAIGNYWADHHAATAEEIELLQALANTTSVAIENVQLYAGLEQRVHDRTEQLAAANAELEAFSYSVSHDLRSPISVVLSYAQLLAASATARLEPGERQYLRHIEGETMRMASLIQDLLRLSQVSRTPLQLADVDLTALVRGEIARLQAAEPARDVAAFAEDVPPVRGDAGLLRVVVQNLVGNAWKYTAKREHGVMKFGVTSTAEHPRVFYVRDNGAGFDMRYAERLFAPFQRLHRAEDFPGTGVGLATVARIVHKHGGKIWAEAAVDRGATFFFTLGPRGGA